MVLVHGTPSRALVWRRVAAELARSHAVYVYDLLGFGDSERRVDQDVSLVAHGEVLAELIELWGLDEPAAVGHDIGGATVLRAHLVDGAPLARIALLDAVALRPWITDRTRALQRLVRDGAPPPADELAAQIAEHLRSATSGRLDDELFASLFGQWDGEPGRALYLRNVAQLDEDHTADVEARLGEIAVPVLVVWGERDAWLPLVTSERLAGHIPGARRVVIPSAGHFAMEDEPEAVARELARFLG